MGIGYSLWTVSMSGSGPVLRGPGQVFPSRGSNRFLGWIIEPIIYKIRRERNKMIQENETGRFGRKGREYREVSRSATWTGIAHFIIFYYMFILYFDYKCVDFTFSSFVFKSNRSIYAWIFPLKTNLKSRLFDHIKIEKILSDLYL